MKKLAGIVLLATFAVVAACSSGGGGSVAGFCSQASADESAFSSLGSTASDSAQGLKLFEDLTNKAPSEIKSDMVTILNALKAPSTSAQDSSQGAALTAASQRVVQFFKDKCHIDLGATTSTKFSQVGSSISN